MMHLAIRYCTADVVMQIAYGQSNHNNSVYKPQ